MIGQQGRLHVGHQVAGRYQVAHLIGTGDTGEVYDVRDITTGYAYALKLLRPELTQTPDAWPALCDEAQRASSLESDVIAKAYDFQAEPMLNAPYVLGEYVTFPSLYALVNEQGPMGLPEFESIMRYLAQALDLAHQSGLVHRALKPQNIFATPVDGGAWQVRITDFGVGAARAYSPPPPGWSATPGWLSAEQADPSIPPSPSMDIYALGLVAFWVLTGRSPFLACRSEPADLNMLWAEMTAPLPPASQRARELGVALSPTMDSWFARALAVSPAQRFASVSEMSQALFALVGSSPRVPTMRPSAGMASPPAAMPEPFGQPDPYQQQQPFQQQPFQQQEAGAAYPQEQPPGMAQDVHGVPMPALPGAAPASEMDDLELFQKPKSKILVPAIVGGALALVAVIALVIWLVFGGEDTSSASLPAASSAAAIASTQEPESKPAVQQEAGTAEAAPEKPTDALVSFLCTPDCEQVVCGQTKVDNPKEGVRLEPGKYTCTATAKGYTQATDSFTVTAGEDLKREITLKKVVVQYTPPTPKPAKTCGTLLNPCK